MYDPLSGGMPSGDLKDLSIARVLLHTSGASQDLKTSKRITYGDLRPLIA